MKSVASATSVRGGCCRRPLLSRGATRRSHETFHLLSMDKQLKFHLPPPPPSASPPFTRAGLTQIQNGRGRCSVQAAPTTSDNAAGATDAWVQKVVEIPHKSRGCHVITRELVQQMPEIEKFRVGTAHLFVLHTSCSLTINENASPDVPLDLNDALDTIVPEGNHYRHLDEGLDDMPAHVKSSMMGASLIVPVSQGRLLLGIWQGIYLNEHRNYGGPRRIAITINGMRM